MASTALTKFVNDRLKKRSKFMKTAWTHGEDGLPVNPAADKNCKVCNGHGITDAGHMTGCILENCPGCWT